MKYDEMMRDALEILENDDDLFCSMVDELDSWNGFADGFRAWDMYELDDLFCDTKVSDFLDKLGDHFDHRDNYFCDTIYGIESTDNKAEWYRDNTCAEDVLDAVIENANHIYFYNSDFEQLINDIINYDEGDEEMDEVG